MTAARQNRPIAGILSLALGVMIFSIQDAILKALSGEFAVTQAIYVRCVVALPILFFMVYMEAGLRSLMSPVTGPMIVRGLILLVAYTTYYMAIAALPLAEAVALFFVAPVLVTLLSGPLLGEKASVHSWVAVFAGFIGVLIILRPGTALFEPAAILSLVSAATYALAMVYARRLGASEPSTVMAFYQNAVYLVGSVMIAVAFELLGIVSMPHPALDFLVRPWAAASLYDFGLMASCGVIAAVAMSLLTHAYRSAPANIVTVFEYTGMIWAPLWGFAFFAEVPGPATVIGTVLIITAGLYSAFAARFIRRVT